MVPTGPLGASSSFCLHRRTPKQLFDFGSSRDSFAYHISLLPRGKASLYTTKKVTNICQPEPDDYSHTGGSPVRGRSGALAMLRVPKGSREAQTPQGTGSDSRKGRLVSPTLRTSQPCLLLHQRLLGTIMPKGPFRGT